LVNWDVVGESCKTIAAELAKGTTGTQMDDVAVQIVGETLKQWLVEFFSKPRHTTNDAVSMQNQEELKVLLTEANVQNMSPTMILFLVEMGIKLAAEIIKRRKK
jgi:hypothetical protein